jgi:hypothetical protein
MDFMPVTFIISPITPPLHSPRQQRIDNSTNNRYCRQQHQHQIDNDRFKEATKMCSTSSSNEPICTAVLLVDHLKTLETVETDLQTKQLNVPFLSQHAEDDQRSDTHAVQSPSSSTSNKDDTCSTDKNKRRRKSASSSSTTVSKVKILNFLTGLCTGVMFSCAGFTVLLQRWHYMLPKDVLFFSLVWGIATSAASCLLFSILRTGTCCYFGNSNNNKCLKSPQIISILENCFATGTFLGFCGVCTWTDVAYGTSPRILLLAVVVAAFWACLMIYCAFAAFVSRNDYTEEEQEQPAKRRRSRQRSVHQKPAARLAEKSKPKALLPKYSKASS